MKQQNIFFGNGYKAQYADIAYKCFMSRRWFSYKDVLTEYDPNNSNKNCKECEGYGELKKLMSDLMKILGESNIEISGNKRNKCYRYTGESDDPLKEMRIAKTINNLKTYWEFCQDSAGFFPMSWLEYFFQDCKDLLDIKNRRGKGEMILASSLDRKSKNIELLPYLYEMIKTCSVLTIKYKPFDEEERILIFHPHFLKEFNGRWHLYGHAEKQEPQFGYALALDRIIDKPKKYFLSKYICAPDNFYHDFFFNIVGVSHRPETKTENIVIRAHSNYIFNLTETKPIHHSQETLKPFSKYEDGEYAEFLVRVEVNNEFIGRILQMGAGLEIMSPQYVRDEFKDSINKLSQRYL